MAAATTEGGEGTRVLRATSPVCWNDVNKFWALLKYEDVRTYRPTQPCSPRRRGSRSPTLSSLPWCRRTTPS
jgi:hypothetical protein